MQYFKFSYNVFKCFTLTKEEKGRVLESLNRLRFKGNIYCHEHTYLKQLCLFWGVEDFSEKLWFRFNLGRSWETSQKDSIISLFILQLFQGHMLYYI